MSVLIAIDSSTRIFIVRLGRLFSINIYDNFILNRKIFIKCHSDTIASPLTF